MRHRMALAVLAVFGTGATPLPTGAPDLSGYRQMVKAERAFAAMSVQRGMKAAFLENLCGDAVVFRPGPVNGRKDWQQRTPPGGTLNWAPGYAEVASDGALGYTTGPWEYTPGTGKHAPPAYGDFVSVWKRQKSGEWCVAVDIGVSHPKSRTALADVRLETRTTHGRPRTTIEGGTADPAPAAMNSRAALNDMMSAEREYAFDLRSLGLARALSRHGAPDLRFLREGVMPGSGLTTAISLLGKHPSEVEWQPAGSAIASSGDMGYDYGVLKSRLEGAKQSESKAYLHVWSKDPTGAWKLALDLENDFPKH